MGQLIAPALTLKRNAPSWIAHIKFWVRAIAARLAWLISVRVAINVIPSWLFVSMACKIILVTVKRASKETAKSVKV